MPTYYVEENNKIIKSTSSVSVAKLWNEYKTTEKQIIRGWDGYLYIEGTLPIKPEPTDEEQKQKRAAAYQAEVDPITAHIQRLRDEEGEEEKIKELIEQRKQKVEEIKGRYPYKGEK